MHHILLKPMWASLMSHQIRAITRKLSSSTTVDPVRFSCLQNLLTNNCKHTSLGPKAHAGVVVHSQSPTAWLHEKSSTELREIQLQDMSIGFVLKAKEKGSKPASQEVKGMSMTVRRLCQLWDRLKCQDGQLWRLYDDRTGQKEWLQLVIPSSLREEVLREVHQGVVSGHLGEAEIVARKLVDEVFCRFSPPEQLHSDQGRQFESVLIRQICNILKIEKSRTTAYHPQCDGLVERFNRTLKHMLATSLIDHPFDWDNRLRKVCMAVFMH